MIKDSVREAYRDRIARFYVDYLSKYHKDPSRKEFHSYLKFNEVDFNNGVYSWQDVYKNISEIRAVVLSKFPDEVKKYTFNEDEFGTQEYLNRTADAIKNHTKYIISTVVNNKPANIEFLSAIKNYAERNNAAIIWLISHDVRSQKREFEWNLDPILKCGHVITEDTILNDNVMISGIVASAKQINPLTGMLRFCPQLDKTIIYPGCKHLLYNVARVTNVETPHKAVSVGAVTIPDYNSDKIMSGRTSYIAEKDHHLGGIIVEIEDEKRYHIRPISAAEDGSFTDLNTVYHVDGSISSSEDTVMVVGDVHVGYNDTLLFNSILEVLKTYNITEVILHDINNASSVSHHEENNFIQRILRNKNGQDSLIEEANDIVKYLNKLTEIPNLKVSIVNSNHDRHFDRYLENVRYIYNRDYKNSVIAMKITLGLVEGTINNPLQFLVENLATEKLNSPERIQWLKRDESYKKYGVELGFHGDEGKNGGKGSLKVYANNLYNAVVGHSHTGGIEHQTYQVGTTSKLNMDYNHGLSSWTRTCCLVYSDGKKQLIDFVPNSDGGYTYFA